MMMMRRRLLKKEGSKGKNCLRWVHTFILFRYSFIVYLQRLGQNKPTTEAPKEEVPQCVEILEVIIIEPPKQVEEKKPPKVDVRTEIKTVADKEVVEKQKVVEIDDKKEELKTINIDEESLTPPLLPSMKIVSKESVINVDEGKKNDKDRNKKSEWDMFADQDIFKANSDVSGIILLN